MNVTCGGCGAIYRVDPAKVPADGVRARCSACDHVFWVRRPAAEPAVVATPAITVAVPSPVREPAAEANAPVAVRVPMAVEPASGPQRAEVSPPTVEREAPAVPPSAPAVAEPPAAPAAPAFGTPVAPAFARPAFGAAPLRSGSTMPPAARDLMPPPADATRVTPATPGADGPADEPVAAVPPAVAPAPAAPARPAADEPPPVVASAAVSALGGILPPSDFEAPRPIAPAAPAGPTVPRPAGTRPVNPFLQQDPVARARRLARALVSDMVTYHPGKKAEGLRDGTLPQLFEEEIRKSWEEYAEQVGRDNPETSVRFREALNEILADGRPVF